MSINRIKVNTTSLKNDAQSIAESINIVEKLLSDLENYFSKLDAMWDGEANEAFRKEYNSDIDNLRTIMNNFKVFNRYENSAADKYDTCEQNVSSVIDSIRW